MYSSVGGVQTVKVLTAGAPATTTTTTSEQALLTFTIPANTLSVNGASLRITYFAHTAANGNNKTVKVRIGGLAGTVVYTGMAAAMNNQDVILHAPVVVTRTGATTATAYGYQVYIADKSSGGVAGNGTYTDRAAAVTWANANDLVITATTPTAAGDLTLDSYIVELLLPLS